MANKGAEFRRDFLLTCATQAAQANPFGDSKKEYHHGFMSRNGWAPNHIHCKSLRCRVLAADVSAVWRIQARRALMHSWCVQLPPLALVITSSEKADVCCAIRRGLSEVTVRQG